MKNKVLIILFILSLFSSKRIYAELENINDKGYLFIRTKDTNERIIQVDLNSTKSKIYIYTYTSDSANTSYHLFQNVYNITRDTFEARKEYKFNNQFEVDFIFNVINKTERTSFYTSGNTIEPGEKYFKIGRFYFNEKENKLTFVFIPTTSNGFVFSERYLTHFIWDSTFSLTKINYLDYRVESANSVKRRFDYVGDCELNNISTLTNYTFTTSPNGKQSYYLDFNSYIYLDSSIVPNTNLHLPIVFSNNKFKVTREMEYNYSTNLGNNSESYFIRYNLVRIKDNKVIKLNYFNNFRGIRLVDITDSSVYFLVYNDLYKYNYHDNTYSIVSKLNLSSNLPISKGIYNYQIEHDSVYLYPNIGIDTILLFKSYLKFPNYTEKEKIPTPFSLSGRFENRYANNDFLLINSNSNVVYLKSHIKSNEPFITYSDYSSTINSNDTLIIKYYTNIVLSTSQLYVNDSLLNENIDIIAWQSNPGSHTITHRYSFDGINFFEKNFYIKVLKKLKAEFALDRDKGYNPLRVEVTDLCQGDYTKKNWYLNNILLDSTNIKSLNISGSGEYKLKVVIINSIDSDSLEQSIFVGGNLSKNILFIPNSTTSANPSNFKLGLKDDIIFYTDTVRKYFYDRLSVYNQGTQTEIWSTYKDSSIYTSKILNIYNNIRNIKVKQSFKSACYSGHTYKTPIAFNDNYYVYSLNNPKYINGKIENLNTTSIDVTHNNTSACYVVSRCNDFIGYSYETSLKTALIGDEKVDLIEAMNDQICPYMADYDVPSSRSYGRFYKANFPKSLLLEQDTLEINYSKYFNYTKQWQDFTQSKDNFLLWNRNKFINYNISTKSLDTITKFNPNNAAFSLIGCSKDYVYILTTLNNSSSVTSVQLNSSTSISMRIPNYYSGKGITTTKGNLILFGDSLQIACYHVYNPNLQMYSKIIIDTDGSKATIEDIQEQLNGDFKFLIRIIPEVKINSLNSITTGGVTLLRTQNKIYEPTLSSVNETNNLKQITISPNPANNYIELNGLFESYEIIDLTGVVVQNGLYENKINLEMISKGLYFLKLTLGNNFEITKLIKL